MKKEGLRNEDGIPMKVLRDSQEFLDEYSKKIMDVERYDEMPVLENNPFTFMIMDSMKLTFKTKGAINGMEKFEVIDRDTGEALSGTQNNMLVRRKQMVDKQQFVKIYNDQLKSIFELSHTSLKVFGYFIYEMQQLKDSDYVLFDLKSCMKFCNYSSHVMVYRGLTELIKKLFICKTSHSGKFWINPRVVFNGERIVVFNEFVNKDYFEPKKLEG